MKQTLCRSPCRMFWHTTGVVYSRSALTSPGGWTASTKWRKLCVRVREHEWSKNHKECYISWRELERRLLSIKGVDSLIEASYQSEVVKWCNVMRRIIDVAFSLLERSLAFSRSSHWIMDPSNGNFLRLIELLSRWDPSNGNFLRLIELLSRWDSSNGNFLRLIELPSRWDPSNGNFLRLIELLSRWDPSNGNFLRLIELLSRWDPSNCNFLRLIELLSRWDTSNGNFLRLIELLSKWDPRNGNFLRLIELPSRWDPSNGNFLRLIELLSRWDPIQQEHVQNAKGYQEKGEHLQLNYLCPEPQNEFISSCSSLVKQDILLERLISKYLAVIADATPDCTHVEQTTFLMRYLN